MLPTLLCMLTQLVLNSKENLVLITSWLASFGLKAKYCGLRFQMDTILPMSWLTIFKRPGLDIEIRPEARHLVNLKLERLMTSYYPPKVCSDENEPNGIFPLSWFQLQSVFWLLGGAAVLGGGFLALECLTSRMI